MKITKILFLIGLSLLMLCGCDKSTEPEPILPNNSINKILPLGASRVQGARPTYESYRYQLWIDLEENNWTFDFIGSQSDNASYPSFNSNDFDTDHEGRGGWTSEQILNGLDNWLSQTGSPDIVLFSSPGGNDILQNLDYNQALININAIIDLLQMNNPEVTIIVEQLAPGRSDVMATNLGTAFNQMVEDVATIAEEQSTDNSEVIAVDMFTGFNDSHLADLIHYNEKGAEFIASRYYRVLESVLE